MSEFHHQKGPNDDVIGNSYKKYLCHQIGIVTRMLHFKFENKRMSRSRFIGVEITAPKQDQMMTSFTKLRKISIIKRYHDKVATF